MSRLKFTKIDFFLGLSPRARWGSLQRSPDRLAGLGVLLLREGKGGEEEMGRALLLREERRMGEERGRKGRGDKGEGA